MNRNDFLLMRQEIFSSISFNFSYKLQKENRFQISLKFFWGINHIPYNQKFLLPFRIMCRRNEFALSHNHKHFRIKNIDFMIHGMKSGRQTQENASDLLLKISKI